MNIAIEMKPLRGIDSMNNSQTVFGCFELDLTGTVLYSKTPSEGVFGVGKPSIVGQNFFENLTPLESAEEFRKHFMLFANSRKARDEFSFNCQFGNVPVKAKVLLMQVKEREFDEYKRLIIVDVRQV